MIIENAFNLKNIKKNRYLVNFKKYLIGDLSKNTSTKNILSRNTLKHTLIMYNSYHLINIKENSVLIYILKRNSKKENSKK